jgi:hypothetical protein
VTRRFGLPLLAIALTATPAHAFYTRGYFERPAERGGAGRLYYTGSERERGWDCTACHQHAAERIRIVFTTEPGDLIETGSFTPDAAYRITVSLQNEHLGFESQFNSNGFVAEFSQARAKAGTLSSGPGTELAENGRVVLSLNDTNGLDIWTFRWTAPPAGTGLVVVNLGAVDGDGAGRTDRSFQDHLHDDVFVGALTLRERPAALGARVLPEPSSRDLPALPGRADPHPTAPADNAAGMGLVLVLSLGARRLRRVKPRP